MSSTNEHDLLGSKGEMAGLIAATDWSLTPLGPAAEWPQSLRTIVRVMLSSRFAMWLGWGPELTFLYNDAYGAETLGAKHPWALGRPSREVWAEIWNEIGPRIEGVLQTGVATWDEDLLLFLERSGYQEETYHTFSYSPVTDDGGTVCGHLCVVTEKTEGVIGERRMALLRDTAAAITSGMTESDMFRGVEGALSASRDLPFVLVYVIDDAGTGARLVCRAGLPEHHPLAAASFDNTEFQSPWAVGDGPDAAAGHVIDLAEHFPGLDDHAASLPSSRAIVLPMTQPGQRRTVGIVVAGLNPFRQLDPSYRSFVDLFVGQLSSGVANAHAYEQERQRATALADLDRAKTTFFSNVSHEFRTPLTLLIGPLEELQREPMLQARQRELIDLAHRNSLRLLKLVNTLLDFSRIEAGRVRARFEPTDLGAFTTELASTFRSAMQEAGLEYVVRSDIGPDAATFVDREMWEQIVLNLISNAFKFTLRGSIEVSLRREDGGVALAVRDTGVGIPYDEQPRIFERFHRVEGTHGRSHEGTGIGLALVHELVKLHGGEITVLSQPERGSEFTVSLRLGSAHLPTAQVMTKRTAAAPVSANPFVEEARRWLPAHHGATGEATQGPVPSSGEPAAATARILLADDNADMREYAHRLLSERWHVDVVANGRDALRAARTIQPDVIVSDVMMPELDGFGLLREVRADPQLRNVPVVLVSARAGEDARLDALAASADDYLVKPFSARDFLARIDAQIGRHRQRVIEERHAQRMQALFAHAPVGIAVLRGPDHVFELSNERYQEHIGGREVVGRPIREALPELADQGIYELLDAVRTSGEPYVGQSLRVMLQRTSDHPDECFFDFVYQPLFDADGNVDAIVAIVHEVTALAAAKRDAETASRLKDEFLATLSHELRTPLNAILGYSQLLRGGVIGPDRLASVLETIERNAQLQEKLVSDVLDVSRIITGKLRMDVRPVDLTRVVQDAIDAVTPTATAKGVRLQAVIDQSGVPIAGDAERLQQVLWNLMSNAIKFTSKGGRVQVRLERVNSHIEVTVSDTGEGIAPEFLPHVFERFRQADSAFTRTHGGLGLGLAISRHLVEAHGGRIDVTSPGKGLGTTARVELPLMIVHDDRNNAPHRVHPTADLPTAVALKLADLTGIRVLLVDDDADALSMAQATLTAAGAAVHTANSAAEALRLLDRERFDAAVLDIGLPQVDGYELLRRIRARTVEAQGTIPAAALTAYARTSDRTRSLQAGFRMHLSKPVQPNELAAAVLALARVGG